MKRTRKTQVHRGSGINDSFDGSIDLDAESSLEQPKLDADFSEHDERLSVDDFESSEANLGLNRDGASEDINDTQGAGTELGIDDGSGTDIERRSTNVDLGLDEGETIEPRGGSKKDPLI